MRLFPVGLSLALLSASTFHAQSTPAPVAYVYVSTYEFAPDFPSKIYGFSASSSGKLTPITGSPYAGSNLGISLTTNGKWLFATKFESDPGPYTIYSYRVAGNGSLKLAQTNAIDAQTFQPYDAFLDHTGSTLYPRLQTDEVKWQALAINQANGKLSVVNTTAHGSADGPVTFTANNLYAYGAACYRQVPSIFGFMRRPGDGAFVSLALASPATLIPYPANETFCPEDAAADPNGHFVVSMGGYNPNTGNGVDDKLAVFTPDKYGNLATTSTYQNMAHSLTEGWHLSMSPKGFYLASTGNSGLQIFLMHGSKPLTALTKIVLPGTYITNLLWDNNQHLYALAGDKLYVLNVSTKGVTQAAGSPYTVPKYTGLVVLPIAPKP